MPVIIGHVESEQAIRDASDDLPSPGIACFTYDASVRHR
jgi:hypothetical protein